MEEVLREAKNLLNKGEPFVLATVVGTKGSTPQKPGAKLLVREDGTGVGTLGWRLCGRGHLVRSQDAAEGRRRGHGHGLHSERGCRG